MNTFITYVEIIDAFRSAMFDAGITPPDYIQADGQLHRFYIAGHKVGSQNGAYVCYSNGHPAGYFEDFKVIEKDGFNRLFIKYLIEFYLPEFAKSAHGSTMQHITRKELERFSILVPLSIQEQTKIAEILSCIDKAIEQTETMIAKQQWIKTGLMQDLLSKGIDEHGNIRNEQTHAFKDSELGRIPVEWDVINLQDVANKITDGDHHTPKRNEHGIYLLSARNVLDGQIDISNVDYVSEDEYQRMIKRCYPEQGDILISCSGSVGRVSIVPRWLKCVLVRSVALVKLQQQKIKPRFAEWVLRSENIQTQILARQKQGAQANLFQGEIALLEFALPPIQEQQKIAELLDKSDEIQIREINYLHKLKRQKTALMQDLLSGKVRVNQLIEN